VVEKVATDLRDVVNELFKDSEGIQPPNKESSSTFWLVRNDGSINADIDISSQMVYTKWRSAITLFSPRIYGRLYIALAAGGHDELLFWLVENANNFDSQKCYHAVRVAAFAGHMNIVWRFIRNRTSEDSTIDLFHAAFLGSVEGGRLKHIENLSTSFVSRGLSLPPDPILELNDAKSCVDTRCEWSKSLAVAAVHGLLDASKDDTEISSQGCSVLQWLLKTHNFPPLVLLRATEWILGSCYMYELSFFRGASHLVNYLITELKCEWWRVKSLRIITECLLSLRVETESEKFFVRKWLEDMISIGQDIQITTDQSSYNYYTEKTICFDDEMQKLLSDARASQLNIWSQFQVIKDGRLLYIIQNAFSSGSLSLVHRDNGGLLVSHLAAAYNRIDVLAWLVEEKGMSLDDTDSRGRDVLTVARASNAQESILWINRRQAEVVAVFVSARFRGRVARQKLRLLLKAALNLQAWFRGALVRSRLHSRLHLNKESSNQFLSVWDEALRECLSIIDPIQSYKSWETLKEFQYDYTGQLDLIDDDDMISDRIQMLSVATEKALMEISEPSANDADDSTEKSDSWAAAVDTPDDKYDGADCFKRIKLTRDVVKWLRVADPKYKDFFVRRVQQLSSGESGRKLAKRLVGCQSLIYESYLEQKAGHRILWTPRNDDSILIWFVASHDRVPRYLKLIDDSENRSSRQWKDARTLFNDENECNSNQKCDKLRVQLDPRSNTPLKLFEVLSNQIEHVADQNWKPQLYLTEEERDIVETHGTVLVLGRSGTGKTVCIANRMHYDRHRFESDTDFSQLFVARSQRLCTFVKTSVEESATKSTFATFDQLLASLERTLPAVEGSRCSFLSSQKMDYQRFKREVHTSADGIDALIAWSKIRSFIKGSIEAQQKQRPDIFLSWSEYMDFGKRRCRLPTEQRQTIYKIFQRYNQHMKEYGLWDYMDRVASIVERLEHSRRIVSPEFETVHCSKVYVDEVQVRAGTNLGLEPLVLLPSAMYSILTFSCPLSRLACIFQDYTQAEIYIFFLLSGPGDLFLAGDPCQSVVEGVDFRFEDIRSVGYFVCGKERRELIPDKPKTVSLNLRSHSGILNAAAAVLRFLFAAFPDSAKQLKEDRGLFAGPRPGVFSHVSYERLHEALVTPGGGVVILTHDALVSRCKDALGGYPLVYGIREAKGLEFQHVVLLDFFGELPQSLQKAWRELLLGRSCDTDFSTQYPEVEGQLKLRL